jgi:hypothetical protein
MVPDPAPLQSLLASYPVIAARTAATYARVVAARQRARWDVIADAHI